MSRPAKILRSSGFICVYCKAPVNELIQGGRHRNHCPHCLASLHVDIRPGDRRNSCSGSMKAIALWKDSKGEWKLLHQCQHCLSIKSNRIASDDSEEALAALARRNTFGDVAG